jgi:hypothetical protein
MNNISCLKKKQIQYDKCKKFEKYTLGNTSASCMREETGKRKDL